MMNLFDRASKITEVTKAFIKRLNVHESYQVIFSTPDGNRVLSHICKVGYVFKTTQVKGDPYETAIREGRRQLALAILAYVCKDHGELQKQMEATLKGLDDAS